MTFASNGGKKGMYVAERIRPGIDWKRALLWILLAVVLFASLLQLTPSPEAVSLAIAIPATFILGLVAVLRRNRIEIPKSALLWYLSIWVIHLPHAISPPLNEFALIRIPVFAAGSFVLLFVIPQTVPHRHFFSSIFYIASGLAILGLLANFLSIHQVFGFPIVTERGVEQMPILGVGVDPLTSILRNPNTFGKVTAFGAIAGISVVERRPTLGHWLLLGTTVLALILTLSRGALLAFVGGVTMYIAYRHCKGLATTLAIIGSTAVGYTLAALFELLPDPLGVATKFQYGRGEMWSSAIGSLVGHELFGWGFQPLVNVVGTNNVHSAYIFVLVTRGVIGFIVHVAFLAIVLRQRLFAPVTSGSATLLGLYSALLITMLFDQAALFGFAFNAVWPTLIVGYSLFQPE